MLKFLIFSFLLFNIGVSDAGEVDVNKVSAVLRSVISGVVSENLNVAIDFRHMTQSTWTNTLDTIGPSLKSAHKALEKIGKYLKMFADTLAQSNSRNSNNVYVSNSILNANYAPIAAFKRGFQNIIASQLKMEVMQQERELAYQSGYAVINPDQANKIISTLNYIADQWDDLANEVVNWKEALKNLSKALANNSGNSHGALIFKQFSKAVAQITHYDILTSTAYRNLAQAYKKLNQSHLSGSELILPPQQLTQVTNDATQQICDDFNRIAGIFAHFLGQLKSDNKS